MDTEQEFVRQMIVTKNGFHVLMELFLTFYVFILNADAQRLM